MKISEAKVLITGGSTGIGLETAKLLIEHGATVAICGRNKDTIAAAAESIGALAIVADVGIEQDVIQLIELVKSKWGTFNVLINNAGFGTFAPLTETTVENFQRVISTNVLGTLLCAREASKHFIEKGYGNIVNISSTAGKAGFAGGTVYTASKFAVQAMTECWRAELRKHNIRVMQVNPSEVQTDFIPNSGGMARPFNESKLQATEIAHTILSMLEMNDRGFITEATVFATNPKS